MKKQIKTTFFLVFLLFGLIACAQSEQVVSTTVPEVVEIEEATSEPEPMATLTTVPTETPSPQPSPTTEPTATVEPTDTPEPSPTPDLTGGGSGKIIFISNRDGEETFYIMNYDGSEPEAWIDVPDPISDATSRFVPRYSPDGSKIAYVLNQDGTRNIFVANVDGTETLQLTTYTDPIVGSNPVWSPDGRQIAYDSNDNSGLHLINSDGSGHMALLDNPNGFKGFPSWSPDGTKIIFNWSFDSVAATESDSEIFVINGDGTAGTPLTENEFQDIGASWSPDGTKIAFHSNRDGNFEIYVMNADGSEQTRLTDNDVDDFSPAWSPNGELVVYSAVLKNADDSRLPQIVVMNADGSNPRNLTDGQNGFNPYWLP